MDAHFVVAEAHARTPLHDLAFSARPDAPVLPYVAPRHRMRGFAAWIRGSSRTTHVVRSRRQPRVQARIVGCRE
jgi:hypothetical protein